MDKKRVKNLLVGSVIVLIVLFLIIVAAFLSQIQRQEPEYVVAITIDTEYPFGVEYAYETPILDGSELFPSEAKWLSSIENILGIAERQGIRLQFNILGRTAENYPGIVKKIAVAEASASVSCHSYSHKKQTTLGFQEKFEEVKKCKDILEKTTRLKIKGSRFPYTDYDGGSFDALTSAGYVWESSVWQDSKPYRPFTTDKIIEFPLYTQDDWGFFIKQRAERRAGDEERYFDNILNDIKNKKQRGRVYVVILHDWIFVDEKKLAALESFIVRLKKENIKVQSLDDYYSENFENKV
jgi:peptidoglycan/xylan/chitin deacetylase (PgdA/CDA1 family)